MASNRITSVEANQLNLPANVIYWTLVAIPSRQSPLDRFRVIKMTFLCIPISFLIISFIFLIFISANYVNGSTIQLVNNQLTKLDQDVFGPIVQGFAAAGFSSSATFIDASLSKFLS